MTRPNYFNHDSTLEMMGVTTGFVETSAEDGFIPDIAAIEAAIHRRHAHWRWSVPITPPVRSTRRNGSMMRLLLKHNIWLILDETYRDFLPQQNGAYPAT